MDLLDSDHLLDTKPATELIDGKLVRKVSPWQRHQELELRWVLALNAWAGTRGKALHEWRHRFTAPGHAFASLVPDVAYVTRAVLDELGPEQAQMPPRAPQAVVEILSRGDSERNLAWKIGAYLGRRYRSRVRRRRAAVHRDRARPRRSRALRPGRHRRARRAAGLRLRHRRDVRRIVPGPLTHARAGGGSRYCCCDCCCCDCCWNCALTSADIATSTDIVLSPAPLYTPRTGLTSR